MNVLVGCEHSGIVRDEFIKRGHNAVSCDLFPTDSPGPHYQGNVLDILEEGWDLAIFHPPCTHLAVSGAHLFKYKQQQQAEALHFVSLLLNAPIPKIALENPVGIISTRVRKPDQIIQPYWFGEPYSKKTCLWLKNLPLLVPTNMLSKPECGYWENQTPSGQNKLGPGKTPDERGRKRSLTYKGVAEAFASQWGNL